MNSKTTGVVLFMAAVCAASALAAPSLEPVKACQLIKEGPKRLACFDGATSQLVAADATDRTEGESAKKALDEKAKLKADANTMLNALMRLQVKTSTGVNYRDYTNELSEAKLVWGQFQRSPSFAGLPKFAEAVSDAMGSYQDANTVWNVKMTLGLPEGAERRDPSFPMLLRKYPGMAADYKKNGSYIVFDNAIGIIFGTSTAKVKEVEKTFDEQFR